MVAGCSGDKFGRTLGFIHDAPDEFTVTTRAPLAMPTSFALPPPRPGETRPQEQSERTKAEEALVPQMALGGPPAGNSPGQQALVQAAGPPAAPGIRTEVDQEAARDQPSNGVWRQAAVLAHSRQSPGSWWIPQKEAQRLRENSALGQSQETGDTPIVQPKQRGVAGRDLLAIEADLDAPHFIQVGAAPVFRGVGLGELVCRCGTVLIERYLPGNFLAIRIQCFRCGAVSSTPGLPDGEILTRAAVPVVATRTPAVTTTDIARGSRARLPGCGDARLCTDPTARRCLTSRCRCRAPCWRPPPRTMTG